MNAENCSSSQQHAVAEKSEDQCDIGSRVMRPTSKTLRLPIRLVPERNQNAQIASNNQEFLP
jgi:hypothetical protein